MTERVIQKCSELAEGGSGGLTADIPLLLRPEGFPPP